MVREGAAAWKSLPEEAKALDGLELPYLYQQAAIGTVVLSLLSENKLSTGLVC